MCVHLCRMMCTHEQVYVSVYRRFDSECMCACGHGGGAPSHSLMVVALREGRISALSHSKPRHNQIKNVFQNTPAALIMEISCFSEGPRGFLESLLLGPHGSTGSWKLKGLVAPPHKDFLVHMGRLRPRVTQLVGAELGLWTQPSPLCPVVLLYFPPRHAFYLPGHHPFIHPANVS